MNIMQVFKKLFFALPFLLLFYWFGFGIDNLVSSDYSVLFSLDMDALISLAVSSLLLLFSLACFGIFLALAQDYKLVLPVSLVAALSPVVYLRQPISFLVAGGVLLSFGVVFYFVDKKLKTYLSFQPNLLLSPAIKTLATLLLVIYSLVFYFNVSNEIKTKGFQIPDSLIEAALKIASPNLKSEVKGVQITQVPSVTPEQIEFLRKNPDLLKEYGLDSSVLDTLESDSIPGASTTDNSASTSGPDQSLIKNLVKTQFENIIKPYLPYIPAILALLFFVTLQTIFSFMSIFLPILLSSIFWILEKTSFIHFEKEMREVRKLIV